MAELNFQDNNSIPGMAHMAQKFLEVIKNRADEAQIGLDFEPKQDRRTKELYLEAVISFRALLGRGYPIRLQVHAAPRGNERVNVLNVGYSVSTDEAAMSDRFASSVNWGSALEESWRSNVNLNPENQRQLQILVDTFCQLVYVPTVQDLLDAASATRPPGSDGGFLGIR